MLPFCTFHCHPQSLDSGSTPEDFAKREVELGSGSLTMTDHGTVGIARQIYDLAKKYGLKPILGLEGYLRDDDCAILKEGGIEKDKDGKTTEYAKYYHLTTHALSQAAFERMVRLLTRADLKRGEQHGSERKPIFRWADLEEMLQDEMTVGTGCLIGVVQRHLLLGRLDLATKYYEKLRGITKPGNFYVEVFPHRCDHYWDKSVYVEVDGKERRYHFGKWLRVTIDGASEEVQAYDLAGRFAKWKKRPEVRFTAVKDYHTWIVVPESPTVTNVRQHEGFIKNECTAFSPDGDLQKASNIFMLRMAAKYRDPIVISDDSHFARPEDKDIQDLRLMAGESAKTKGSAPSMKFYESYHRQSGDEAFEYFRTVLGVPEGVFRRWVENSYAWRDRFGWKFVDRKQLPTKFYPADTLGHTMKLIREVGRMDYKNSAMVSRLQAEIKMLHKNGVIDLLPYFFIGQEAVVECEKKGKLTGPGRGSAAGLLLTYLLGITHVDPLRYGLSKERFLTESRIRSGKLPDIDMDFGGGAHRDHLVNPNDGWIKRRFGDHQAQISTDSKMRLRTSIQDAHRMLDGEVPTEIWPITKKMPIPPMGITDHDFVFGYKNADGDLVKGALENNPVLKAYAADYPRHWKLVAKALGLARQKGRHASAWVITNEPVSNFIPMTIVSEVPVTSYTMSAVEAAGGIKMDFLGVNSINDIEVAVKLIQERRSVQKEDAIISGRRVPAMRLIVDPKSEQLYDLWDLPEDQDVFREVVSGHAETVFQFNTPAAQQWFKEFMLPDGNSTIRSVEDLATFTALDRPGGLDAFVETEDGAKRNMLQEFAARAAGRPACVGRLAILDELFPETYGVLVYQESLQKAFVTLGGTTPEEGDEFRVHVSKKQNDKMMQDKAVFMRGAIERLGQETADKLWGMLEVFSNYGFNKSHAVCYALIGYTCAWLKHHYPLEWWTAVLRNADRSEIGNTFWEYCGHLVDPPDVKLSGDDFQIQGNRIRAPMKLLEGVGEKTHQELVAGKPYANLRDFLERIKTRKKSSGRSAVGMVMIQKLIVSGTMDAFFESSMSVYDKLVQYAQTQGEVDDFRYIKTGLPRVEPVDERFRDLKPLQKYLLQKSILTSFEADLEPLVAEMGLPGWKKYQTGAGWYGQDVVSGPALKDILESKLVRPDEDHVAAVAYVSKSEPFWGGKALKVYFEVGKERFVANMWPKRHYNEFDYQTTTPAAMPAGAEGGICIITLGRWRADKDYAVEGITVVAEPFKFKVAD